MVNIGAPWISGDGEIDPCDTAAPASAAQQKRTATVGGALAFWVQHFVNRFKV